MLPLTYASPEAEHIIVKVNGNADVRDLSAEWEVSA